MEKACKICGNLSNNKEYTAKDHGGPGDEYEYIECSECGCLQMLHIPEDLSVFYPEGYYSFTPIENTDKPGLMKLFAKLLENSRIFYYTRKGGGVISRLICAFYSEGMLPIEPGDNVFFKRVLDVGCGHGGILKILGKAGFTKLYGVDPFIESDIIYKVTDQSQITIYKKEVFDICESFDYIMLNHTLEHMPDQEKPLRHINSLLDKGGTCIIRIPTVSSYGWKKYGESWFALTAPGHLFLHSIKSMEILSHRCGFRIEKIKYDSVGGLIVSRYLKKGYNDEGAYEKLYSPKGFLLLIYDKLITKYLNLRKQGETVAIHLRKAEDL